jgi:hypothetical protein
MTRWSPLVAPLAQWLGPDAADVQDGPVELAGHDARLAGDLTVLAAADELVSAAVARHRPAASGPAAAVELDLLRGRLSSDAEVERALLHRAAVLCAGEQWDRLAALLPALRNRVARASEALAELAVRASRLERGGRPTLTAVPSSSEPSFAAEAMALDDELRRWTTKAGAQSAYAAADGAFLPSLAAFLG